jgi:polyisoprenoid-binding protein YceI
MTTATQEFTGTITADPVHSSVLFAVQHLEMSSFRATFGDVDARLEGGESGISLEGRARVASVSITNPPEMREQVVNGEEFFDGGNHPEIVFRSTRVELAEDGGVAVDGELEIKGIASPSPRPAGTARRSRIPTGQPAGRSSPAPSSIAAIGT